MIFYAGKTKSIEASRKESVDNVNHLQCSVIVIKVYLDCADQVRSVCIDHIHMMTIGFLQMGAVEDQLVSVTNFGVKYHTIAVLDK